MAELTLEQKKAMAMASARLRVQQNAAPPATEDKGGVTNAIDAFGRGVADMATFGFADEMGAGARWLGGKAFPWQPEVTYDQALKEVRGEDQALADAHPVASVAGSVTGALGLPMGAARTTLGAAAQGGAMGGLYGFGSGEGGFENRRDEAIKGGLIGGAAGAAVHGIANSLATRAARKAIPDEQAVRAAGNAAYDAAEQAGVVFTPRAAEALRGNVTARLADMGYDPALQPGAAAVVRRLEDLQGQNVTLKGLDTLRKVASNGYVPGNASNNRAISQIIDEIDNLVANPAADDILAGNAQAGAEALATARDMWSRQAKADRVSGAVSAAELRAGSTGSGGNVDNATRQNLRRILEKPRGFSQAEQDALRTAVMGSRTQNALRLAGKLSPSGNGLMAALGIGGTMVNPAIGALSLGGMAAKTAADAITQKNVQRLAETLLSGGQTAQQIGQLASRGVGPQALVNQVGNIRAVEGAVSPAMARIAAALLQATSR